MGSTPESTIPGILANGKNFVYADLIARVRLPSLQRSMPFGLANWCPAGLNSSRNGKLPLVLKRRFKPQRLGPCRAAQEQRLQTSPILSFCYKGWILELSRIKERAPSRGGCTRLQAELHRTSSTALNQQRIVRAEPGMPKHDPLPTRSSMTRLGILSGLQPFPCFPTSSFAHWKN